MCIHVSAYVEVVGLDKEQRKEREGSCVNQHHFEVLSLKVKAAQSCPALWGPMDYKIHGILQARIMEWVAFPFSRGSSQTRDGTQVPCVAGRLFTI